LAAIHAEAIEAQGALLASAAILAGAAMIASREDAVLAAAAREAEAAALAIEPTGAVLVSTAILAEATVLASREAAVLAAAAILAEAAVLLIEAHGALLVSPVILPERPAITSREGSVLASAAIEAESGVLTIEATGVEAAGAVLASSAIIPEAAAIASREAAVLASAAAFGFLGIPEALAGTTPASLGAMRPRGCARAFSVAFAFASTFCGAGLCGVLAGSIVLVTPGAALLSAPSWVSFALLTAGALFGGKDDGGAVAEEAAAAGVGTGGLLIVAAAPLSIVACTLCIAPPALSSSRSGTLAAGVRTAEIGSCVGVLLRAGACAACAALVAAAPVALVGMAATLHAPPIDAPPRSLAPCLSFGMMLTADVPCAFISGVACGVAAGGGVRLQATSLCALSSFTAAVRSRTPGIDTYFDVALASGAFGALALVSVADTAEADTAEADTAEPDTADAPPFPALPSAAPFPALHSLTCALLTAGVVCVVATGGATSAGTAAGGLLLAPTSLCKRCSCAAAAGVCTPEAVISCDVSLLCAVAP